MLETTKQPKETRHNEIVISYLLRPTYEAS